MVWVRSASQSTAVAGLARAGCTCMVGRERGEAGSAVRRSGSRVCHCPFRDRVVGDSGHGVGAQSLPVNGSGGVGASRLHLYGWQGEREGWISGAEMGGGGPCFAHAISSRGVGDQRDIMSVASTFHSTAEGGSARAGCSEAMVEKGRGEGSSYTDKESSPPVWPHQCCKQKIVST